MSFQVNELHVYGNPKIKKMGLTNKDISSEETKGENEDISPYRNEVETPQKTPLKRGWYKVQFTRPQKVVPSEVVFYRNQSSNQLSIILINNRKMNTLHYV